MPERKAKQAREEKKGKTKSIVKTRGRIFEGFVVKKFPKRVVIEFFRPIYVRKYQRYYKKKTRLHARLPEKMEDSVKIGDYIKVQECRPLSKLIHFLVLEVIRKAEEINKDSKKDKK
jgi:small subunit ribosomal protein S17